MKNITLYIDLAFCLIVLPIMVAMSPIERWIQHFTAYMLCAGIWLYLVYFINRVFTVPFLFGDRKKKIGAIIMILTSIIVTLIFSGIELYNPEPNIHDKGIVRHLPQILQYQQSLWTLFMIVETFSFSVGLLVQTKSVIDTLTEKVFVKQYADKGYISQSLFGCLWDEGVHIVIGLRSNMKQRLMPLYDSIMLRKRSIIESINDMLKNVAQQVHTRHRSVHNFLMNRLAARKV